MVRTLHNLIVQELNQPVVNSELQELRALSLIGLQELIIKANILTQTLDNSHFSSDIQMKFKIAKAKATQALAKALLTRHLKYDI